jgi:chromosome segregation ATPase
MTATKVKAMVGEEGSVLDDSIEGDSKSTKSSASESASASKEEARATLSEYVCEELERKTTRVAALENALNAARRGMLEEERKRRAAERAREDAREDEALTERKARVGALETENEGLRGACGRLEAENARLEADLSGMREDMEREMAARVGATKRECDERVRRVKKQVESTIDRRMDGSIRRILAQNRKMADELRLHVAETDALQRQYAKATSECQRLAQRVAMTEGLEREYAERGASRAKEMKLAHEKIQVLEDGVRELIDAFESQKIDWQNEMRALKDANEEEVRHLKRSLAVKSRDLVNVRRLAKEVVCYYEDGD